MALRRADPFDPLLAQRALSALVMATATLLAVLAGGWLFIAYTLAAVLVMAGEWTRLMPGPAGTARLPVAAAASVVPMIAVLTLIGGRPDLAAALLLTGAALAAAVAALVPGAAPDRAAGGAIYVGLPALALVWLRTDAAAGLAYVVWLLLVVWATDGSADIVGRTLRGPRLAPRISPSKTWSGLLGGLFGAGLVGGMTALVLGAGFMFPAALAIVLALVAQGGDLFESFLKRRASVKDSGHLIPGHGGLLDRVDGLVFAAPLFAALVWLQGAPPG
jgi:phosphatidate cytidylyltransferase